MNQLRVLSNKSISCIVTPSIITRSVIPASVVVVNNLLGIRRGDFSSKCFQGQHRIDNLANENPNAVPPKLTAYKYKMEQIRLFSNQPEHISINEVTFDNSLHQRELEMHKHKSGPISRIFSLSRDLIKNDTSKNVAVVDICSQPAEEVFQMATEYPWSSISYLASSVDNMREIADMVLKLHLPNISVQQPSKQSLNFSDGSIDLVTSCYGIQKMKDPESILIEVHRILKPGGTLIVSALDHLGTEPILQEILNRVSSGTTVDNIKMTQLPPSLTQPHALAQIIEKTGLRCIDIEYGEYPLYLSDGLRGAAFDLLILPIKEKLNALRASGENNYAFEDARKVFDEMIRKGDVIGIDSKGRIVVNDNRYKILVARRIYEDSDFGKESTLSKKSFEDISNKPYDVQFKRVPLDVGQSENMVTFFFDVLNQSVSDYKHIYSPFSPLKNSIEIAIQGYGRDAKIIKVLDIGSRLNHPQNMIADSFPASRLHELDLDFQERTEEEIRAVDSFQGLDIGTSHVEKEHELSQIPDGSVDIVTSAFGLTFYKEPKKILDHVHRILKPGGTFITTTWDSISLEQIGSRIIHDLRIENPSVPVELANLDEFATPHKLEHLLESSELNITLSTHHEFPLILSHDALVSDGAFETAVLCIRPYLEQMIETGANPDAFIDARKVFNKMVKDGDLISIDKHGCLITVPNRYHLLVARRHYEGEYSPLHK